MEQFTTLQGWQKAILIGVLVATAFVSARVATGLDVEGALMEFTATITAAVAWWFTARVWMRTHC